jgi:hypothetical protein
MSVRALAQKLKRLGRQADRRWGRDAALLPRLREDPSQLLSAAGLEPDPWQAELLRGQARRLLLLCARQAGKSLTAAALALKAALLQPPALVLLLSPTHRQSGELFRDKVKRLFNGLGRPATVTCRGGAGS